MVKKKKSWPPMGFVSIHSTAEQQHHPPSPTLPNPLLSAACRGTCDPRSTGQFRCTCTVSTTTTATSPTVELGRRTLLAPRRSIIRRRPNTSNVRTITSPNTQQPHDTSDTNNNNNYNKNNSNNNKITFKSCSCSVSAATDNWTCYCANNDNDNDGNNNNSSTPPPIPFSVTSSAAAVASSSSTTTKPLQSFSTSGIVSRARSLRRLKGHFEGPPTTPRHNRSSSSSSISSPSLFYPVTSPPPPLPPLHWPSREGSLHYNPGNIIPQQRHPKSLNLHTDHHRPLQFDDNTAALPYPPILVPVSGNSNPESTRFINQSKNTAAATIPDSQIISPYSSSSSSSAIPPKNNLQSQSNNHLPIRTNKFNYPYYYDHSKDTTNLNKKYKDIPDNNNNNNNKRRDNFKNSEAKKAEGEKESTAKKYTQILPESDSSWQSPISRTDTHNYNNNDSKNNNMYQPPPPPPEKQPPSPPTFLAEESRSSTEYCRDSHDLTISPTGRESLVENMLLSLDRLGSDPLGDDPRVNQFFQSPSSSSYLDDNNLEYVDDEDDDNDDDEEDDTRFGGASAKTPTASTFNTKAPLPQSSPTSYQYPLHQYPATTMPANPYLNRDKSLPSTPTQHSSVQSGFVSSPTYSRPETTTTTPFVPAYNVDIHSEAAPTPTISNRDRDRAPPKVTSTTTSPASKLSRKRSNTTKSVRKDRHPAASGTGAMDDTAKVLLPGQDPSNTPLSLLQTNKSNTKPGFFRRVFGSSNKQTSVTSPTYDQSSLQPPVPPIPEQVSLLEVSPSVKPPPPPLLPPPPPPPATSGAANTSSVTTITSDANPSRQQTVTKKASGFFRRRKKSMSEVDVISMPKTPFHHLDVTTPTTPLPPVIKPATNILSAPDEIQESTLSSKKSGTPGNYVWDNTLMNKVTTSPTNKNTTDTQKKPTIRTVGSYDVESKPPVPLFESLLNSVEKSSKIQTDTVTTNSKEVGGGGRVSSNKNVTYLKQTSESLRGPTKSENVQDAKPSSSPHVSPNASEPTENPDSTYQGLSPDDHDNDDSCNNTGATNTAMNRNPKTDSKASDEMTNIVTRPSLSSKDVNPALAVSGFDGLDKSRGLPESNVVLHESKLDEENLANTTSMNAPSRNNSMPVVVLQDSLDGPGEVVEPQATTPDNARKDEEEEVFTDEEKVKAAKIFEGDEEFIHKSRAAAWLGENGDSALRIRKAYMNLFDWAGINILASLRMLCEKLVLKGETQQVERIMDAMAYRWVQCNSSHGFKTFEVVQTVTYSLLLLNTDLHMADIPQSAKMTRSQFIRNTMGTIKRGLIDAEVDVANPAHCSSSNRSQTPLLDEKEDNQLSPNPKPKHAEGRSSIDHPRTNRLSFIRGGGLGPRFFDEFSLDSLTSSVPGLDGSGGETGGPFLSVPFTGTMRQWETVIEAILKDFYASVRLNALPLHGVSSDKNLDAASNSSSLGITGSLRRTPSTVSKSPSEMSLRTPGDRYGSVVSSARSETHPKFGSKWGSRNRSRPRLYPSSFAGSSRTSFEDRMWSPSASSTWSKYSLDKTTASMMSVDSLGAGFGQKDYQQSIGFANALSHAIIREEVGSSSALSIDGDSFQNAIVDDDLEDLSLHGAPWAKEGMIKHKHHLEAVGKKAKNRGWTECFAVVEKGWMRLFLFPSADKKKSQKGGIVGGGNWMENAESVGSFMLRQTIASALPPPGYSKARPHVLALSLPNGAVHLFQAGTADIINEWVTTANYWSARLSKEPLVGGVSNVEYGWGNCLDPNLIQGSNRPPTSLSATRPSFQESLRSSMDHGSSNAVRARLPGDKAVIADWNPPSQSMVASNMGEKDQLNGLTAYVKNVEAELQKHNELRSAMIIAFTPRHINYSKAMNNWERKSSYLLREIVKFRTYIDALQTAIDERQRIACEKESSSEHPEEPEAQKDEPDTIESQNLPEIPTSA